MTPSQLPAIRTRACDLVAALGSLLDSIQVIEETFQNPSDAYCDAMTISQSLAKAKSDAERMVEAAHVVSLGIDLGLDGMTDIVAALRADADAARKGGAS